MDINELLPKIYRCDANTPDLIGQSISFKDFLFISSSVEELTLKSVEICYDDGKPVMLETIFNENITIFQYEFESKANCGIDPITFESMKHISQLPTHKDFEKFTIEGIPEAFDFDAFVKFFEVKLFTKY
uniref:Uncharacterized protein n=1 Tax=Panagrolaimus davidi TaxID=227884 RepID=A0A914QSI2_9BILA